MAIPNTYTSIGYQAFYQCSGLTSVTIGNSVTSIDGSAFSDCSGLTSITIPDSVTSIGIYAFAGSGLTSVIIHVSEEVGNYPDFSSSFDSGTVFTYLTNLEIPISLVSGWNMISIPGQPLQKTDPSALQTTDSSLILPLYRWNPTNFSYEAVTELKFGQAYWTLTTNPNGTKIRLPVAQSTTCKFTLQAGWNMIGSVSQTINFTQPDDNPDNSIVNGSLYHWNPTNFYCQAETEIRPGQGYWVLTLAECQLVIGDNVNPATTPQVVVEPELLIWLDLSSGNWSQKLEIGTDQLATASLDRMDQVLSP